MIIVNEHTASAAEMVAAFAQENGLATIVGTETAGRLLSGTTFRVGSGYIVGLPVAAYLTWKGKLIEGKGVSPLLAELSVNNCSKVRCTDAEGLRIGKAKMSQESVLAACPIRCHNQADYCGCRSSLWGALESLI